MKNYRIILINIIIVLVVISGISFYTQRQRNHSYENAVKAYENSAISLEKVMTSYMNSEQQLVDSWAKIINGSPMSMENAMDFAREAVKDTKSSVHIVWSDDFSKGFSTHPNLSNLKDYTVSYDFLEPIHTYETSPEKILKGLDFSYNGIHITPSYN